MREQKRIFRSLEKALEDLQEKCLEKGYDQEDVERLMFYSFELGKRYKWFEVQAKRIKWRNDNDN